MFRSQQLVPGLSLLALTLFLRPRDNQQDRKGQAQLLWASPADYTHRRGRCSTPEQPQLKIHESPILPGCSRPWQALSQVLRLGVEMNWDPGGSVE